MNPIKCLAFILIVTILFCPNSDAQNSAGTERTDTIPRALPSPLPAPPFPSGDWAGSPVIGLPADAPDYALQKALGLANSRSRIKIYGWVDPSYTASTSKVSNIPVAYNIIPNKLELSQAVLRIERQPNTVQTDHVDWGFRSSNCYGLDYRYTVAKGWFSDQFIKDNKLYGYDPVELYGLLYFPKIAKGLLLKVGRYISPSDIEAQLAPDNYLYSHSVMFSYDPFTCTGVIGKIKLSNQWQLDLGVHGGNDMAVWTNSSSPTAQAFVRWTSKNNNQSLYVGINSLGSGVYKNGHDNLQMVSGVWGWRFNKTLHMMTEAYCEWEKDAASGGSASYGPVQYGAGGGPGNIIPGISKAIGAVNYFQILLSGKNYVSIRNDYLNDLSGWRTGFATTYTSHTAGFVHYFMDWLFVRPEFRYDRNWDKNVLPYDLGTKKDQITVAMDMIVRF
jgi:hypothetical protein